MHRHKHRAALPAPGRYRLVFIAALVVIGALTAQMLSQDIVRMKRQATSERIESGRLADLQRSLVGERRSAALIQKNQTAVDNAASEAAISLLKRIEASWTTDISLLRMDTDMGKRRIRMQIKAVSKDALFDFVDRLERHFGDDVFLEQHTAQEDSTDRWMLDASLVLGWK